MKPVCSELHSEILKCYLQNTGQTLTCSSIASQYVRCVNNAKQVQYGVTLCFDMCKRNTFLSTCLLFETYVKA